MKAIHSREKVITFTIEGPAGSITCEDPKTLMEILFGTGDFPHTSCNETIQELFGDLKEDEKVEYNIVVEKRFTQHEIDTMPESDGDIH